MDGWWREMKRRVVAAAVQPKSLPVEYGTHWGQSHCVSTSTDDRMKEGRGGSAGVAQAKGQLRVYSGAGTHSGLADQEGPVPTVTLLWH